MPERLSINERLQRARDLLAEAQNIQLPEAGQERGHAVVHMHSLLNHAATYAHQVAAMPGGRPTHINRDATAEQRAEAERLQAAIDAARPEILDNARRREAKKIGRPRRAEENGERVTVRLTPEEIRAAIEAGGTLTEGIRRGLEALKREDGEMDGNYITVEFSDDALWGGDVDPAAEGFDAATSAREFSRLLRKALRAEYPDAEITIRHDINDRHRYNGREDTEEAIQIGEIINQVWQAQDWMIKAE